LGSAMKSSQNNAAERVRIPLSRSEYVAVRHGESFSPSDRCHQFAFGKTGLLYRRTYKRTRPEPVRRGASSRVDHSRTTYSKVPRVEIVSSFIPRPQHLPNLDARPTERPDEHTVPVHARERCLPGHSEIGQTHRR